MRRTASYDVLSIKIRPTVSPVGEGKNEGKSEVNIQRFEGVYFRYMGKKPCTD